VSGSTNPPIVIDGLGGERSAKPPLDRRLGTGRQAAEKSLPVLDLHARTADRALDCVHCGLCLPACPTYTENGLEGDSPRGRIVLMQRLNEGKVAASEGVLEHLDLCLDCRACETACPSGVVYHELIEETRIRLNKQRPKSAMDRLIEAMFFHVFPYPARLRLAVLPARIAQKLGLWKLLTHPKVTKLLPRKLEKMQTMLPESGPLWSEEIHGRFPAKGEQRAVVGLLTGCVSSVLQQHLNRQTIEVLQMAGCEVVVPRQQGCCGAIHHHGGDGDKAEQLAKANIDAFLGASAADGTPLKYVVSNAAGCGAMLSDYGHLLRDDPGDAERAKQFEAMTRDVSEVLVEFEPERKPTRQLGLRVTYHDACHLAHGQGVTAPPRQVLDWIPGIEVVPLFESEMCCGAAGTYNLSQPEMARQLGERKIRHIEQTGASVCVTGNIGCGMQIDSEARRLGVDLDVMHPVSLLHRAYFG